MPFDRPHQSPPRPPGDVLPRAVRPRPPAGLIVERRHLERVLAHLQASLPNEGCGLLATARGDTAAESGELERVVRFYPGTNIDDSATRYTMDPMEVLAALRDMEANGWRLGAIVHSHPASPPTPSATDLREAHYQGALMMIVSFAARDPVARAWAIDPRPHLAPHMDEDSPTRPFRAAPLIIGNAAVDRPPDGR